RPGSALENSQSWHAPATPPATAGGTFRAGGGWRGGLPSLDGRGSFWPRPDRPCPLEPTLCPDRPARVSVAASAGSRPCRGNRMRHGLQFVRERREDRFLAGAMGKRLGEQPVGEPRVARQQGAVEIRADGA